MPARDALWHQMTMRDELEPGGLLGAMLDGFERSQRGLGMRSAKKPPRWAEAMPSQIGIFAPEVPYNESGDGLRQYWARHLDLALAYYIDPRMTELVTAAAESMPADAGLRPSDMPSTHGFLYLPTGLAEVDIRGQLMVHNAVVWFERAGGVDLWFVSNKYDERDMINLKNKQVYGAKAYESFPQFMPAIYTRIEYGEGAPMAFGGTKVLPPEITALLSVHRDPVTGNVAWAWPEGYDVQEWLEASIEVAPSATVQWVMATWRLMQQSITDVASEPVDRMLRKAARKRNMRRDDVTVIRLRKRKRVAGEGPEQEIEWSHRWLRRGHWRQQWYGPRDGELGVDRYQTPVWIHPTICGPEDKPLLVRDHVYSLER